MAAASNWSPFHARVHQVLRDRRLLQPHQPVLVAVSGGQDSLCLIRLLLDLQPKWGWQLAIAHCDHAWRSDSGANAEYVQHLAQTWQVPFYCETATEIAKSEAEARNWRYQVLMSIAQDHQYRFIVTGHTASDRAETLLYNLVRGSGADGLQALTWQREIAPGLQLIRPLLAVTRSETAEFCQKSNLQIWEDSTNSDWKYARNRIRQELLPYLRQHFNPQVEKAFAQTAELLHSEVEYLETSSTHLRQQVQHPEQPWLNRTLLQATPLALQRRVVRQFLEQALPCKPDFDQIEKLVALIPAPNRSRSDPFPGGIIAEVQGEWIMLQQVSNLFPG